VAFSRRVHPFEFLERRWMGPTKEREAPNLVAISERFNLMSGWVRTSLMSAETNEDRADLLEHFIAVALVP
jgi:hypothetical protein